jgi:hypothetical protein
MTCHILYVESVAARSEVEGAGGAKIVFRNESTLLAQSIPYLYPYKLHLTLVAPGMTVQAGALVEGWYF